MPKDKNKSIPNIFYSWTSISMLCFAIKHMMVNKHMQLRRQLMVHIKSNDTRSHSGQNNIVPSVKFVFNIIQCGHFEAPHTRAIAATISTTISTETSGLILSISTRFNSKLFYRFNRTHVVRTLVLVCLSTVWQLCDCFFLFSDSHSIYWAFPFFVDEFFVFLFWLMFLEENKNVQCKSLFIFN